MSTDEVLLPKNMKPTRAAFESLGFKFIGSANEYQFKALIPNGWTINKKGFINYIFDEESRVRVIFCTRQSGDKVISYMNLKTKYEVTFKEQGENQKVYFGNIDEEIYVAGSCASYDDRMYNELTKRAIDYADKNYPGWQDPLKYWNNNEKTKGKIKLFR